MNIKTAVSQSDRNVLTFTFSKNKLNDFIYQCEGESNDASNYLEFLFTNNKNIGEELLDDIDRYYASKLKKKTDKLNMLIGNRDVVVLSFSEGVCSVYWKNTFESNNTDMLDDIHVDDTFDINLNKLTSLKEGKLKTIIPKSKMSDKVVDGQMWLRVKQKKVSKKFGGN